VRAYTWSDIWNHDVQFGFVCGAFAMFVGMLLLWLLCELLAWLAVGRRRQKAPQRLVQQYTQSGGTTGQSWRRG
jgi:hypothetical protein